MLQELREVNTQKQMDSRLKMMDLVLKTMGFTLKPMVFTGGERPGSRCGRARVSRCEACAVFQIAENFVANVCFPENTHVTLSLRII